MTSDIDGIPVDKLRSCIVEFVRFLLFLCYTNRREEGEYKEMKRERSKWPIHKKLSKCSPSLPPSLSLSLSLPLLLYVFSLCPPRCVPRFQEVKRTRETDRKREYLTNRVYTVLLLARQWRHRQMVIYSQNLPLVTRLCTL